MAYKQHQVMTYFFKSLKDHIEAFLSENNVKTMLMDEVFEAGTKTEPDTNATETGVSEGTAAEASDGNKELNGTSCMISFLGFNEVKQHNSMNRIQIKRADTEGNEVEYMVKPPFTFELKTAAVINGQKTEDRLTCLSELVGFLKEHNRIEPGEYDWAGNEGNAVSVEMYPLDDESSKMIPEKYRHLRPFSMVLSMIVGLESADPESFTRVRERKISAIKKDK